MFNYIVSKKEELLKLARDANPRVRAAAIRDLGEIMDGSLAPVILDALEDPEWEVRLEAVINLTKHNTPVVIPALQPHLEDDSVEVRQVTRDAIRMLRQQERAHRFPREVDRRLPRTLQEMNFPNWMGKIELAFAYVASIFMLFSIIRFLNTNLWADSATGEILWSLTILCVILGAFLLVFVVIGMLQSHLRVREVIAFIKAKPWQRLVEIIFICDVIGWFVSGIFSEIIFLVALSAGLPLSVAFLASELWRVLKKNQDDPPA